METQKINRNVKKRQNKSGEIIILHDLQEEKNGMVIKDNRLKQKLELDIRVDEKKLEG